MVEQELNICIYLLLIKKKVWEKVAGKVLIVGK